MASWSTTDSSVTVVDAANGIFEFPQNNGASDKIYKVKYTDDNGCVQEHEFRVPPKPGSTCTCSDANLNFPDISSMVGGSSSNRISNAGGTITFQYTIDCGGVVLDVAQGDSDSSWWSVDESTKSVTCTIPANTGSNRSFNAQFRVTGLTDGDTNCYKDCRDIYQAGGYVAPAGCNPTIEVDNLCAFDFAAVGPTLKVTNPCPGKTIQATFYIGTTNSTVFEYVMQEGVTAYTRSSFSYGGVGSCRMDWKIKEDTSITGTTTFTVEDVDKCYSSDRRDYYLWETGTRQSPEGHGGCDYWISEPMLQQGSVDMTLCGDIEEFNIMHEFEVYTCLVDSAGNDYNTTICKPLKAYVNQHTIYAYPSSLAIIHENTVRENKTGSNDYGEEWYFNTSILHGTFGIDKNTGNLKVNFTNEDPPSDHGVDEIFFDGTLSLEYNDVFFHNVRFLFHWQKDRCNS